MVVVFSFLLLCSLAFITIPFKTIISSSPPLISAVRVGDNPRKVDLEEEEKGVWVPTERGGGLGWGEGGVKGQPSRLREPFRTPTRSPVQRREEGSMYHLRGEGEGRETLEYRRGGAA